MPISIRSACGVAVLFTALPAFSGGQWQTLNIFDPVMRMQAFSVNAPSGWTLAGSMIPGSSCSQNPSPAYRMTSPDGTFGVYLEPRLDWQWSDNNATRNGQDCMPWTRISAKQVLAYTIAAAHVGFVSDLDTPELAAVRANLADLNAKARGSMVFTPDAAAAFVSYEVNGRRIDERMSVLETCSDSRVVPGVFSHQCFAFIRRAWAPAGRLESISQASEDVRKSERFDQQWNQQYNALMTKRIHDLYAGQTQALLAQGQRAQDQRMRAHQEYMGVMQRGADLRNMRFKEGQYAKRQVTDDRVDFLLDCQRYPDGTAVGNCPNRQTAPRY
jgi:hypothetical protein